MPTAEDVRRALPPAHREVIDALVRFVEGDPRFRFIELCCSAARGAADELSDLDLGLGVADEAWPAASEAVLPAVHGMGEVVGALAHRMPEWGEAPHLRVFAQFASGPQLDMVAFPASRRKGLPAGSVALYDPDGRLSTPMEVPIRTANATNVTEWAFLAWAALLDLDKYVRRGSAWEALERLHEARAHVWRLHAVASGIDYPAFGLTSLLDAPSAPPLPPAMAETVAALDIPMLARAGHRLAGELRTASARASAALGGEADLHAGLADYALRRLEQIGVTGRSDAR
jgi:hypothetical protein